MYPVADAFRLHFPKTCSTFPRYDVKRVVYVCMLGKWCNVKHNKLTHDRHKCNVRHNKLTHDDTNVMLDTIN